MLRLVLPIDENQDLDGEHHLEDDAKIVSSMMFDPSVEKKY